MSLLTLSFEKSAAAAGKLVPSKESSFVFFFSPNKQRIISDEHTDTQKKSLSEHLAKKQSFCGLPPPATLLLSRLSLRPVLTHAHKHNTRSIVGSICLASISCCCMQIQHNRGM